jgi:Flp pilus assembly protein TadD
MAGQFDRLLAQAKKANSQGHLHKAKELYEKYVKVFPKNVSVNLDLGAIYMRLEKFEDAAELYARMLEGDAKQPIVLSNLGGALLRLGKLADARTMLEYCLELDPKNIYARINLGGVLQGQEEFKLALENALEAVSIDPTHALAFNNLGSAFSDLAMNAEAKHAFETASMLDSTSVDALINLAGSESKLLNPKGALAAYNKVLTMLGPHEKQRAEAIRFFACFEHQKLGNLEEFWDGYECGFSPMIPKTGARSPNRQFNVPKWDGQDRPGKVLLIWREQGVGDEILYSSIMPDLKKLQMKIIFECDPRTVSVWQRSFPEFTVRQASFDSENLLPHYQDYDFHLPICSLGSIYRRATDSFQKFKPYLIPDPLLEIYYRDRLSTLANGRVKVGVLWRSIKLTPGRSLGYTAIEQWHEILKLKEFYFVSLQYNLHQSELEYINQNFKDSLMVFDEINLKDDFERTCALISNLDIVVSPNTTMFELSGALGVKTLLMWGGSQGAYGLKSHFIFFPSVQLIHSEDPEVSSQDTASHVLGLIPKKLRQIINNQRNVGPL